MDIDILEELLKQDYKLFVDTSSLMQENSEYVFFRIIAPLLCKHERKLFVPKSVINEISKHIYNENENVKYAQNILDFYARDELYAIEKKFDEPFADNAISALFLSLRLKYNLCLITNDNSKAKDGNLSQDILDLKNSRSTERIKDIRVFFIKDKSLVEFKNTKNAFSKNNYNHNENYKIQHFQFRLLNSPKNHKYDSKLATQIIPIEKDFVIDNKGEKHQLLKQIGRTGGEGSVYLTDTNYICKIYKPERITKFRYEKIKLLINNSIKIKNVCLPELIAFNQHKEFVGYFMPKADGVEIKTSIFIPPLFKQKFPGWNRIHLVSVAINIIKMVKELHDYNIIIGDINPNNILIKNENDIYFIDTDSFQIEGYPCSVGMIPYTRIENHGKRYDSYLRTKTDDIFALSTLVFQLMLPGKLPYSFSGGGSEKENMNPSNFPYNCYDGDGYNKAPDGQWVYIWSHLPRKLKELFGRVFKKNENIPIDELIKEMDNYLYQLNKNYQTKEIFPLTSKQIDSDGNVLKNDVIKITCECGNIFAIHQKKVENYKVKGWNLPKQCDICKKNKKKETKICTNCERRFFESNHTLCKNCRGKTINCSSCNSSFLFTDGEKSFYDKKGLEYPKKCKKCRDSSKKSNTKNNSNTNDIDISNIIGSIFNMFN